MTVLGAAAAIAAAAGRGGARVRHFPARRNGLHPAVRVAVERGAIQVVELTGRG
jgi:hypothetical protein